MSLWIDTACVVHACVCPIPLWPPPLLLLSSVSTRQQNNIKSNCRVTDCLSLFIKIARYHSKNTILLLGDTILRVKLLIGFIAQ